MKLLERKHLVHGARLYFVDTSKEDILNMTEDEVRALPFSSTRKVHIIDGIPTIEAEDGDICWVIDSDQELELCRSVYVLDPDWLATFRSSGLFTVRRKP